MCITTSETSAEIIEQLRKEFEIEITFVLNYLQARDKLSKEFETAISLLNKSYQLKLDELKLKNL